MYSTVYPSFLYSYIKQGVYVQASGTALGQCVIDAFIYGMLDIMVKENFQPRIMGNSPKVTFAR